MKKISRKLVVFLAGITCHSFAATEFSNGMAPVTLVTEFTGGASVYSSLPDGFPVAPTLAGLPVTLIGTLDRGGRTQQILLRSPMDSETLRATLLSAYAADGWTDISSPSELGLCRDDRGQLYFRLTTEGAGTKVVINRLTAGVFPSNTTCAQLKQLADAQKNGISVPPEGLRPMLVVPAGATPDSPPSSFLAGMSASSNGAGTRYEMEVENSFSQASYSLGQLFQHLAQQLQQQGWEVDSDDVGTRSAVSGWFKTISYTAPDGESYEVKATGVLRLLKSEVSDGEVDGYTFKFYIEAFVPFPMSTPIIFRPA